MLRQGQQQVGLPKPWDWCRSPAGHFLPLCGGDVPLSGAGDFGLGPKVTKGPPEPLWFRPSGFCGGSCMASEGVNLSSVASPTTNNLPLVRLPALAMLHTDPCMPQPLTNCGAVVRCYTAVPTRKAVAHHRTMNCTAIQRQLLTGLFLSPFVGQQAKLDKMDLTPYRNCQRVVTPSGAQTSQCPKTLGVFGGVPRTLFATFGVKSGPSETKPV